MHLWLKICVNSKMKHFKQILFLILLAGPFVTKAQHSDDTGNGRQLNVWQDSLKAVSFQIYNNNSEPERYNASYTFIKTLVSALKTPHSFNFNFDSLKAISIQTPSDQIGRAHV